MDRKRYLSVLDFAIEREKEAVSFYNDLIKKTSSFDLMEAIRAIELMERNHIKIITELKNRHIEDLPGQTDDELKISELLVLPDDGAPDGYRDLLITAMKREELSYKLYSALAEDFDEPEIKKIFQNLASEEIQHKLTFEKLYDSEMLKEN